MNAPAPGSPEWMKLVTASKVPAILGVSPWESPRSLWHRMRNELPPVQTARAMERGHKLEDAVLNWTLDDHPAWEDRGRQVFYQLDGEDWAGATPDMLAYDTGAGEFVLVDAKTTSTDEDWGTPGTDEVPVYYLASSMWQLAMAPTVPRVVLAALFGSPFDLRYYVIERDDELIGQIIDRCRVFYESLSADVPPELDDSVATYDAIRKLHPDIDRGATVELTEDEARAFSLSKNQLDTWAAEHRHAKSVVLERMGTARVATFNGQTIARRQPNKYGVSLVAVAKTLDTEQDTAA